MITAYDRYMYISSAPNRAFYCIDSNTGGLLWKFSDFRLTSITSPAVRFGNNIIICSQNYIFILDPGGNIKTTEEISNGTANWAVPIEVDKIIYIPTSKAVYQYDGVSLKMLEGFPQMKEQVYISSYGNNIYCVDNSRMILQIYNINEKKIIWESAEYQDKVYTKPLCIGSYIFITDIKNNLYRYNYNSQYNKPLTLSIGAGIKSNIINDKNDIYFVADNGFFYRISAFSINTTFKVDLNIKQEKYPTKRMIKADSGLYFCSDTGKLFYHNIITGENKLIDIPQNTGKLPLIGSPVFINGSVYVVDSKSNIYKFTRFE